MTSNNNILLKLLKARKHLELIDAAPSGEQSVYAYMTVEINRIMNLMNVHSSYKDDVRQECLITLIKILQSDFLIVDIRKYCAQSFRNTIMSYFRRDTKEILMADLDRATQQCLYLLPENVLDCTGIQILIDAMKSLDIEELSILILKLEGVSNHDIQKELKVSKQAVQMVRTKLTNIIKEGS